MSFINRWYYDLNPSPIERLWSAAEEAGVTEPLVLSGDNYSMRLAVDDSGAKRILFDAARPDPDYALPLQSLRTQTMPRNRLITAWSNDAGSPWGEVWERVMEHFINPPRGDEESIHHLAIPDVSRPITVNGVVYHRLALTPWAHRYPDPAERRGLVVALQDNDAIRNAIPLAERLRDSMGYTFATLVDDHTNYGNVDYAIQRTGLLPTINKSLALMVSESIGVNGVQLAVTRLATTADVVALPSGAVVPRRVLEATPQASDGDSRRMLGRKMHRYAHTEGLSTLHLRELAGLTLVGCYLNGGNNFRLLLNDGQTVPDLTSVLAESTGELTDTYLPTFPDEDWRVIEQLMMKEQVSELLSLPLRRVAQQVELHRRQLDSALASVAQHADAWNRAVDAERTLVGEVNDERVQTVLASIVRAGKIRSLNVAGHIITVHTNTIYAQDDRSGAWHRMGDFRITIDTNSLSIRYENLTDTVVALIFGTHPHIDRSGRACVGNFSTISSQLVAANDWLGLVEMCVVFLSNANTNDSAGRNINYWPFVENPEEVGLPPYPSGFQGPVPTRSSRAPRLEPVLDEDGRDARIIYDTSYEEYGDEPRDFDDILGDPRHGDELMLYSERTYGETTFTYDTDYDDWYDRDGYNRDGYDTDGYDQDGYDREGYDREGRDEDGYNRDGYDPDGYDRDDYGPDGYDREGYDREGYDREGYDEEGYSRVGLNRAGLTREEEAAA
jgi:hypothetical protein